MTLEQAARILGVRVFSLAGPKGDGRRAYCNEEGAYLGLGTALVERVPVAGRAVCFMPRSDAALARLLAKAYGRKVNVARLSLSLGAVARALERGDMALANIALVHAELDPLPDENAAKRLAKADRILRAESNAPRRATRTGLAKTGFNPDETRVPAGDPDGGQWTDGADSAAEIDPHSSDPPQRTVRQRLTAEQVGNIVFNETRSLSGAGIDEARNALAHAIRNGEDAPGPTGIPPRTAPSKVKTVPPSEAATYQSIQDTAAQADTDRANGVDPTQGATHFNMTVGVPQTSPFYGAHIRSYGPFNNSAPNPQVPGKTGVYINLFE
jgi:hypothetical protein